MPIKRQKKRKKKKQMRNDAHSLFVFDIAMQKDHCKAELYRGYAGLSSC